MLYSTCRNQPARRITNVAVSVPLPGISSGGSYVHPVFGIAPRCGRANRERLQAGSLDTRSSLLWRNGCLFQHPSTSRSNALLCPVVRTTADQCCWIRFDRWVATYDRSSYGSERPNCPWLVIRAHEAAASRQ